MRKMLVAVALAAVAFLSLAPVGGFAQIGVPGTDVIGIYTATDATARAHLAANPGTFEVYLVVTNPSASAGISGWECSLEMLPAGILTLINTAYAGTALNVATPPEYAVGLAAPLPRNDVVRLATLTFFAAAATPANIYMHPISTPSQPGDMIYADGADPGRFITLAWSSGDESLPVFGVNTGPLVPPIPIDEDTWGGVKNLYR